MKRSWLVTVGMLVLCLGFVGFVAVLVTGHAPQDVTEKVRQTVRDSVLRVVKFFKGSHVVAGDWRLPADDRRAGCLAVTSAADKAA